MILVLAALAACPRGGAAGEAFDFGDMPPLPPPLLDDAAPSPPPLRPPESGALSPLAQPAAPGTTVIGVPPMPPPIAPATAPTGGAPGASPIAPAAIPPAPSGVPPVAVAATPAAPETPRQGKVSGGRVNVRAGPNTQYESIAVLTTGSPVTILAKNGEWYKIVFPADQLASIHKNFVDAEITGEIPEAGVPGVVNQDNSDVHAFYWDKSTVVGKLNKGDPVTIKQERGQWYRIAAPASARAYVFADYVRVDGGDKAVVADAAPPPVNPAVDLAQGQPDATGRLKLSDNDRRAAALKEAYFKRLQESFKREEEAAKASVSKLEEGLGDLEAKLAAIDSETSSRLGYSATSTSIGSAAWAPPDPVYGGYTGWVENIGRVGGAPASFRLTRNGEVRFYLRSDRYNLNDFTGRRVWLNGSMERAPGGAPGNILNVDQIRILTDMEIAEAMRQYSAAAGATGAGQPVLVDPVTAAQPYAAQPYVASDPYGAAAPAAPATPVIPSDPSMLPDVVGPGQPVQSVVGAPTTGGAVIIGSGGAGEVDTDFYENPVVSEIGP